MRHVFKILIVTIFFAGCYSPKRIAPIGIRIPSHHGIYRISKVVPNYVRIDTDMGIKELNGFVPVYRMHDKDVFNVGIIELVQYDEDKVIGKIVKEIDESHIQPGDYIHLKYKSQDELNVKEYIQFLADENTLKKSGSD